MVAQPLSAGLSQHDVLVFLVNLVLAVGVLEALWLVLRRGRSAVAALLPNLLAGLSLSLALRLSLSGAGLGWIAPCLLSAGLAHLLDLHARGRLFTPRETGSPLPPHPPAHSAGQGRQSP